MKKILIALLFLSGTCYGQIKNFITQYGVIVQMRTYDSTAIANAINLRLLKTDSVSATGYASRWRTQHLIDSLSSSFGSSITDGDKGDITVSGSGANWTIDNLAVTSAKIANDAVTYAKLQNISATNRFLGRITASAGDAEELTGTQATSLLDVFTTSVKGLVPAATGGNTTTQFLRKDGTWVVPTGSSGVTGIGTINSQTKSADGAVVSGSNLVLQTVDLSLPGLMTSVSKARLDSNFYIITPVTGIQNAYQVNDSVLRIKSLIAGTNIAITNNGDTTNTIDITGTLSNNTTGSAASLTTGRTISGTGDATFTTSSFNGAANVTGAVTVVKINGTTMSALGTGILKNTTGTGVPSIAINSDLPVMSATVGGAVPTPPNNTTTFLRGDGTFAVPSGAGDVTLAGTQTFTGPHTFNDTKFLLRNVANTFNGSFVNTNTADRIYTLKDAAGTIAFTSDITGTNSGTNTGDNADNSLYSGLVSNANHTGDATGSTALTLATVNSNVGSFGSATQSGTFTVNAKGLITAASNTTIAIPESAVTNLTTDLAAKAPLVSPSFTTPNIGAASGTSLALSSFLNEAKGADIASATTTDIGAATGNYADVTGTVTISGLGTVQAGTRRVVRFTGALTLTYNATSLILPGAANITTVAGDVAEFISLGSGNWRCTNYFATRNIQGVAFSGAANIDIINGTGFVKATGTTLSYDNSTYLTTASAASTYQPLDGDLTTIAALAATTDNFMVGTLSAWASRTPAQARTQLGGTTVGQNIFTLTNPSALGYNRINADNTVTHRSYANVKVDLSLDAVENTALSTWAGTSNITTLGTVATGTWSATTIALNKGGTGSTTASGARIAILPSMTGNALKILRVNAGETDFELAAAGGGSGTVTNTGNLTANSVVLGNGTVDTKVVAGITTDGTAQINLGVNATTKGTAKFYGLTSGDVTVQAQDVAGTGTIVKWPNAASTLPIYPQQMTFTGMTAARTVTFPDADWTAARKDAAQTFTGQQTLNLIAPANSTTVSAIEFTPSGASLETASEQGDMEVNSGGILYYSTAAAERGVIGSEQFVTITSANTLTSQTAVQPIFDGGGGPANGRLTVAGSRSYFFEMDIDVTAMSATSGTFSLAFGGTATLTSIRYRPMAQKTTQTSINTVNDVIVTSAASTAVVGANTTQAGRVYVTGIIRVNAGGTLIPQIAFSTVAGPATPIITADSWIRLRCIGTNTVASVGNWD